MFRNLAPTRGGVPIHTPIYTASTMRGGCYIRDGALEQRGGILPFLIPLIAAGISAIPGIAGAAVAGAQLAAQNRQNH